MINTSHKSYQAARGEGKSKNQKHRTSNLKHAEHRMKRADGGGGADNGRVETLYRPALCDSAGEHPKGEWPLHKAEVSEA